MRQVTNCPNCGAVINSEKCEYCGTVIYDFCNLEPGKKSYIRMKINNNLIVFAAMLTSLDVNMVPGNTLYADGAPVVESPPEGTMTLEMRIIPDDDLTLFKQFREERDR